MELEVKRQQMKQVKTKNKQDLPVIATEYSYILSGQDEEGDKIKVLIFALKPIYQIGDKVEIK